MISIFYSTRKTNPLFMSRLKKSCTLKNNEYIEFINNGVMSLSKAYNFALQNSKHNILICLHDDVHLEKGWDKRILDYFKSSDFGILGVAGTTDLVSGRWWEIQPRTVGRVYHRKMLNNSKEVWYESKYSNNFPNEILQTVCIDGLFMAINKFRILEQFDERFDGFHFYDIPFCVLNHVKGVKIGVVTDIMIKHESIGITNNQWDINKQKFETLYKDILPLKITPNIKVEQVNVKIQKEPKLAIIIPSKDNFEYLEGCLKSLLTTKYKNYKIYIADTGSSEENLDKIKGFLEKSKDIATIQLILFDYYHFSHINNFVVENYIDTDTEVLLFCNDDIEMLNDAISIMMQQYVKHQKHIGTIGCRLHYGDNSIQHGGIALFTNNKGQIGLTHKGLRSYYKADYQKVFDVFGNTGAFMMISKLLFIKLGGFNRTSVECMEDASLNIDCILKGYKNIYMGNAVCKHYESITRIKNENKLKGEQHDLNNLIAPIISKNMDKLKKYLLTN